MRSEKLAILVMALSAFLSPAIHAMPVLVPISGLSPYPDGGDESDAAKVTECNGGPQAGRLYRHSEVEPHLEVNPVDPLNMIATWHQDRWSSGAAQGIGVAFTRDGGVTWQQTIVPLTNCAGGTGKFEGARERASDPWVAWSADGSVAYLMALVINNDLASSAQVVVRSFDGGENWEEVTSLRDDPGKGKGVPFNDKNTMIADPDDPDSAYAIWTIFRGGMGTTLFTKTSDGGERWTPTRQIYKARGDVPAGSDYPYPQGNQIVVLPGGVLLNVFFYATDGWDTREFATIRSFDSGKKWEKNSAKIAGLYWDTNALDWELFSGSGFSDPAWVRDGGILPDVAVNATNGNVYMVWQSGADFAGGSPSDNQVWTRPVITMTADDGDSWSTPIGVPGIYPGGPADQKFLPEVAVRDDGTVAVMYYDFHTDVPGDATLDTDVHVAFFDTDLNYLGSTTITPVFDLRQAPYAGGFFPGDYVGFTTDGTDFLAAFTMTHNLGLPVNYPGGDLTVDTNNRQDVFFVRITWP